MMYTTSLLLPRALIFFFFFNDTATTEIYTLSLHDALPICEICITVRQAKCGMRDHVTPALRQLHWLPVHLRAGRSEEHTSELQSLTNLVCRLLLEKKKHLDPPYPRFLLAKSIDVAYSHD